MIRALRHRRVCTRIALMAVLLLLWSQTALAWHAACRVPVAQASSASMQTGSPGMAERGAPCHEQAPPDPGSSLCAAHCDQGASSPDTARIPALPTLPALIPTPVLAFRLEPSALPSHVDAPPPVPWRRPTPHPAALLLI